MNDDHVFIEGNNIIITLDLGVTPIPVAWIVAQCVDYINQYNIQDPSLSLSKSILLLNGTLA